MSKVKIMIFSHLFAEGNAYTWHAVAPGVVEWNKMNRFDVSVVGVGKVDSL